MPQTLMPAKINALKVPYSEKIWRRAQIKFLARI